jgi:hypothetical protein
MTGEFLVLLLYTGVDQKKLRNYPDIGDTHDDKVCV